MTVQLSRAARISIAAAVLIGGILLLIGSEFTNIAQMVLALVFCAGAVVFYIATRPRTER